MSGRSHLSIGDVLSLLREEFPDVTISKIRFLESQGLVDPERSPSGYRKFYEHDVARLRWVLRKQRDQFLPLKVIRDRLAAAGTGVPPDDEPNGSHAAAPDAPGTSTGPDVPDAPRAPHVVVGGAHVPEPPTTPGAHDRTDPEGSGDHDDVADEGERPRHAPAARGLAERRAGSEPRTNVPAPSVVGAPMTLPTTEPAGAARASTPAPDRPAAVHGHDTAVASSEHVSTRAPSPGPLEGSVSGVSLSLSELCAASGLSSQTVSSLQSLGLVSPMVIGGDTFYDEEALTVAKLVAEFGRYGIEPRHLRMYRNAADREVGLVEQVVTPLLRQRNPESRQRAIDAAGDLARLGQHLRAALVRRELRRQLGT